MILTGRSLCLPSPATVQELFSAARDASIIPDISLDPVLTTFLSLDSSAALQHQYDFLQRSMSREQQAAFGLNLTAELGGSRVTYGGVGVVALALSLLFDQVARQIRAQDSADGPVSAHRSQPAMIFGIRTSSRIGWIIHSYLGLVPGIANSQEKMGETTELYDSWLKLELLDHYERMTTKKRMSSVSMQQWLAGAAFHLHLRIHQVRLNSVPSGSAESLRLSYKSGLGLLIQGYTAYLRRNIQETEAPGPKKPRTGAADKPRQTSSVTNVTCSGISADKFNDSASPNSTAGFSGSCKTNRSNEDFGLSVVKGSNDTSEDGISRNTLNTSSGYKGEEEASELGLLVIEPLRNVSHNVQHHPCQSPAIQQALVTRIINALDLERNRDFFLYSNRVFYSLLRQKNDFELKSN
ncbi:uncharacterized protein LOC110951810 [Acanthochromis polyacanthus]|uniref:uncharacterized protein LOC110951810 n=1 Tax=Acanthochromis polyacanthus TaxID=80966 RepID=UPI000B8F0F5D|nr:uncharacterized protein LOC110951810 [Acanthochromis polyacanthus]